MKKFKAKATFKSSFGWIMTLIILVTFYFFNYYNKRISPKLIDIAETKIEEVTNIYIKNNIVPENVLLDKLLVIKQNSNEEIISMDIETNYANEIMINVVKKIQNNIFELNTTDEILKKYKGVSYIQIPLFTAYDGSLLANLGPKIPVRLSFYEHAFGNIEVELLDYGINNALIKVFLEISLEQKVYIPYKEEKMTKTFRLLIGSKVINGSVPSIYGGSISKVTPSLNS